MIHRLTHVLALGLLASSCSAADGRRPQSAPPAEEPPSAATGIRLARVAEGFESPVHLASPPGDRRLFVVEQPGRIRIIEAGRARPGAFLDITALVSYGGERGLLSVAFHPRYAENGFFFVNYTDRRGDTRIERYHVSADRDVADPRSARLLLHIDQPFANHNGGLSLFGPDGMLWIGMGDGGSGGDPHRNGQNPRTMLGKMLRIDVDRGDPYAIPVDNPWRDGRDALPEIWATGLRNPWRYAFDETEGLLYIADVGQNKWEEIHVVPAKRAAVNFGWNLYEGRAPYRGDGPAPGLDQPVVVYPHPDGCSITGGAVYRGRRMPALAGHYFYSDYCAGWLRSFRMAGGRVTQQRTWNVPRLPEVTSFGEDSAHELYMLSQSGEVYRLEPAAERGPDTR